MRSKSFSTTLLGLLATYACMPALAQSETNSCGPLQASYGPYDFRTDGDKLPIVTSAHFTSVVEQLVKGTTGRLPGPDIAYTLRAIPNHPNALMSMMRLGEREKTTQPFGSTYTVECWFERAIRFRPDDQVVRMIYVTFLTKKKRKPEAMGQLDVILASAKDNAFTYQNLGLLYFDLGEHQQALAQAHRAMELGLMRQDLRDKLKDVGAWSEPTTATTSPPSAPATNSP